MNNLIRPSILIFLVLFLSQSVFAQISAGGTPISSSSAHSKVFSKQTLKPFPIPELDLAALKKQDEENPWANRFAAPVQVDYGLDNSGTWVDLADGSRVWRLNLRSKGALALSILYDDFYLPKGAQLFVYSPDKKQVLGAYTSENNRPNRKFLTGLIYGGEAVIEYYEPARMKGQGRLHIFRIDQAYKKEALRDSNYEYQTHAGATDTGFGTSFACHENVNCNNDPEVQEKKRGIVRIMVIVEEGSGFCTGNLMNNTSVDGRPLVLSAFHCQDGFTPLFEFWKFDFNYESIDCNNPEVEPTPQSILGSDLKAGRREDDFILLELFSRVPSRFNPYFLGWDRSDAEPDSSMYIHHPFGDIKKIGVIHKKADIFEFPIEWDNNVTTPADHHFRVVYNTGYFQPGSSGAALLNKSGRYVGHLHGGRSACGENSTGFFGRLTIAWEGGGTPETRLKDWLDPLNTQTMTLDGTSNTGVGEVVLGGYVRTVSGQAMRGVVVTLVGPKSAIDTTDEQGYYEFGELIEGEEYGVRLARNGRAVNGVNILDMIIILKDILAIDPLTGIPARLAADVDRSGSISTLDRIKIQKVIMGLDQEFGEVPSWQFIPPGFGSDSEGDPLKSALPEFYSVGFLDQDKTDFDFVGVKSGDVNNSADPNENFK
jgi:lysyl endopeptidase